MANLPTYINLESKRPCFSNGNHTSFIIDTKADLDKWFVEVEVEEKQEHLVDATAWIYRGHAEAKYKLLTSAQRLWITTEMHQWANCEYLEFIDKLIISANKNPIIKKVFDIFNYLGNDSDFPILSLLQHYGAPTPLMDWTYNSHAAFFFATEGVIKKDNPSKSIEDYFSIYRINKSKYRDELLNIIDAFPGKRYPSIISFAKNWRDSDDNSNGIFYISDFEESGNSTNLGKPYKNLIIRTYKPLTSIYNQNIIPQEGLFIFNPFSNKSLEEIFNTDSQSEGWNLLLKPFDCFNIHKDLADYLRRKIDVKDKINKGFIYPSLNEEARKIKEITLNGLIN